jgi:hypothetical protein
VIPVLTVRHRHAAGGDRASYEIEARAGLAVAGMHCLVAVIRTAKQANLVYGGRAEVELALESADDEAVQVELCDVHHARRTGAGVIATVDQEFQVFFRLTGDAETRAAVRLRPATRSLDVVPAVTTERFQIVLRARPAPVVAPPPSTPPPRPAAQPGWLADLPEGVRAVFRHLIDITARSTRPRRPSCSAGRAVPHLQPRPRSVPAAGAIRDPRRGGERHEVLRPR